MKLFKIIVTGIFVLFSVQSIGQTSKRSLEIRRTNGHIRIDGILDDAAWKDAPKADKFISFQPAPFIPENPDNPTEVFFLYSNEGIYVGGYLHEKNKDSIAKELTGRDGFGNNDFVGVIFDTYKDKLNGFEYFVTPLGEQWDSKISNGGNEDFSWNAVWRSATKLQPDGWSFEMFLPFSSLRFGKKKMQDWGLNIVRQRQKSGQKLFWQSIDPNANGFLAQEGFITGMENIKPPLRLQLSPYFSAYQNHDGTLGPTENKTTTLVNGGLDVKYGINQAFTLDMTLIPDFGQAQTDNKFLNLGPFEQRFSENRPFFTEGTELFNKGNLFYSRRIGIDPAYKKWVSPGANEQVVEDPSNAKILNATKISGRTQKGLGVGILNAITQRQYTRLQDKTTGFIHSEESMPLTNYNLIVLDQTLKNNSSVSLVNTNVWRSGHDYDANVTSALFDFNNKKNSWNIGGNVSFSNIIGLEKKAITGYAHSIYLGKTSGRLNFNIWQDLTNDKYDKSDLGYFTNNNSMDQGFFISYNWNKPRGWYNRININLNGWYSRLVSPLDNLKRKEMMYQNAGVNFNANIQTKWLQYIGLNINGGPDYNDFYEPRTTGRLFHNKGYIGIFAFYESNSAKKLSWSANLSTGTGGIFKRTSLDYSLSGKVRFNSKFSVEYIMSSSKAHNQPGYAATEMIAGNEVIYFSRRDVTSVENVLNAKYNFTNKMGVTLRARHSWTKVDPQQFYELDIFGDLKTPTLAYTGNANQNYNFLSVDFVYNWQFAQGSFFSIVWKDIGESFNRQFEKNYVKNLGNTIDGHQYNSLSLKVIYFIDYLTAKR